MKLLKSLTLLGFALASLAAPLGASAQDRAAGYPNRPVKLIIPFPAGQATDIITRMLAERLAQRWGQGVVVENRGGGNAIPGMMAGKDATPDGYTFTVIATSSTVINEALYPRLPYNTQRDFVAVAPVFTQAWLIVANRNAPYNNLNELMAAAKRAPGKLSWSVSATGLEFAGELVKLRTGMDIVPVPYKGSPMAVNDLIGGHIQLGVDTMAATLPHIKEGRLKVIASLSDKRATQFPEVATVHEQFPGTISVGFSGVMAPKATPPEIVQKVSNDIRQIILDPAFQQQVIEKGSVPDTRTQQEWAAFIADLTVRYSEIVKSGKVKAAE
ncbi:Bug family tripartite tricarboxylate transporter substrate binding protein [Ramlibacter sp.]|uniref:Bug family tripartite tricarboxylate transporter substrate binding protein n=1 Tax=Ramlibacter sp. TaxID=1917967 RepID=UPI003D10AF4F